MRNFVIEQRVNPFDEFKKYKRFDTFVEARQSLDMLKKHVHNLLKGSEYMKYRIYDVVNKMYYH